MSTEAKLTEPETQKQKIVYKGGGSEAVYGLGLIGAWAYYLTHATTFLIGVLGIFKGIFWPVVIVYQLLELLNK